ncbi:MAG: hypothetical protein U9R34_01205 [Nanoarchaeota archaeon]|nr:hypothetical protein [Nanoarchaeota archaeon]
MKKKSKSDLESRQENLEQYLNQEADITLKDRLENLDYNLQHNRDDVLNFELALSVAGLVACDYYALANHRKLTSNYKEAYKILSSLHETLESVVEHGMQTQVSPEIIELPRTLIEQGAQQIYSKEARTILNSIDQNKKLFSQEYATEPLVEYLGTLKDNLRSLAENKTEPLLSLGGFLGTIFSAVGLRITGSRLLNKTNLESQLDYKRKFKNELKYSLPDLRKRFANNPNAPQAYDFLDKIAESGVLGYDLLNAAELVAGYPDEKYKPAFEAINLHPEKYQDRQKLQSAFEKYD